MVKKTINTQRRTEALSRDQIVEAAIDLLDKSGEVGLTFQALSKRLATGPGAIYWHVANKGDLLRAACDAIVARTMDAGLTCSSPQEKIREFALGVFDAIDAHPWVGSVLTRSPGQVPMVRILERIGQQVCALGVHGDAQWSVTSALLSYILGVGTQNAANAQLAIEHGFDRSSFLGEVSAVWSQLDPQEYPFVRSIAGQFSAHDDRVDFHTGIDLILGGIGAIK